MKKRTQTRVQPFWGIVIALVFVLIWICPCWAGKITAFSADQVMIDPQGKVAHEGKIYVMPNKISMTGIGPHPGSAMQMIFRQDLNLHWMINPDKKIYFEKPLNEKEMAQHLKKSIKDSKETILGTETVNGYKCTKKRVETRIETMGFKRNVRSIIWVSNKLDFPLRTQSEDGALSELRHIKKGKPSSSHFEIPEGYRKITNMMEFMRAGAGDTEADEMSPPVPKKKGSGFKLPFKLPKGVNLPFGKD